MKTSLIIFFAILLLLCLFPLFYLLISTTKDLRETRKKIKQNENEIHEIVYGKKE